MIFEDYYRFYKKHTGKHHISDETVTASVGLYVKSGRHKGKVLPLVGFTSDRKFVLSVDNEKTVSLKYPDCQFVDKDNQPIPDKYHDMMKQEINIGSIIVNSVSAGQNSHALEICKVIEFMPAGGLKVQVIIRNGSKVVPTRYGGATTKIGDTSRTIRIPIEPSLMMMWTLSDFEQLGTEVK